MYMNLLMTSNLVGVLTKTLFTMVIICVILVCFVITFRRIVYMITGHYDINFNLVPKKKKRWTCEYCGTVNDDEMTECPRCRGVRKIEDIESKPILVSETTQTKAKQRTTDGKIDTIVVMEKSVRQVDGRICKKKKSIYKDLH